MKLAFNGFDWNEGNRSKSYKKHGVTQSEIEEVFQNTVYVYFDAKHSSHEERYIAFGQTHHNRKLLVAFTWRIKNNKRLIRPISARAMHKKERVLYEKIKKET